MEKITPIGKLEENILKTIAASGPSHYYELSYVKKLGSNKGVSMALHRLVKKGFLKEVKKGERGKLLYSLTFQGLTYLTFYGIISTPEEVENTIKSNNISFEEMFPNFPKKHLELKKAAISLFELFAKSFPTVFCSSFFRIKFWELEPEELPTFILWVVHKTYLAIKSNEKEFMAQVKPYAEEWKEWFSSLERLEVPKGILTWEKELYLFLKEFVKWFRSLMGENQPQQKKEYHPFLNRILQTEHI